MTVDEVEDRARAVLHMALGVDERYLIPQARLVDQLYADSMELLEMVMGLNEAFGIEIRAEDVAAIDTVADVYAAVRRLLGARVEHGV
ncbi:acyl carrier protein [Chromobacterium vaccinii]|uniref:Acyl carrier protein n=1 Tax=Chromobacterium vaccinii TaxID=1108595 RepID=A0ABV0F5Z0_9NEIS